MSFVKNNELNEQLLESHQNGGLTAEVYKMFTSLIDHRINRLVHRDKNLVKDEIATKCMAKIEKVWQSYSFEKSNAYAYFVSVVDNTIKRWFIENDVTMLRIDEKISDFSN